MGNDVVVIVGEDDEAVDGAALRNLIIDNSLTARVAILPNVNHFGVFSDPSSLSAIQTLLAPD